MYKILLRELTPQDLGNNSGYVSWLNDSEINKYLECRHITHTLDSVRLYVQEMLESKNNQLYGIFIEDVHVGNIKIGSIDWRYRRANIGLLIAKEYWGKGIAKEAIKKVEKIAFHDLDLHKIYAGMCAQNQASLKAFLSNGWRLVGKYEDHCIDETGNFVGCFLVEKVRRET